MDRALATVFTDMFSTSEALRKWIKVQHLINPSPPKDKNRSRELEWLAQNTQQLQRVMVPLEQQNCLLYQDEFIYHTVCPREQPRCELCAVQNSKLFSSRAGQPGHGNGGKRSTSSLRSKQETQVKKIKEEGGDGKGEELGKRGKSLKDSELKWRRRGATCCCFSNKDWRHSRVGMMLWYRMQCVRKGKPAQKRKRS